MDSSDRSREAWLRRDSAGRELSSRRRGLLGCLALLGLVLAGSGTLVVLNWSVVSERLGSMLTTQTEKSRIALFRLGEVLSIGAELEETYGYDSDVTYDADRGARTLAVSFGSGQIPSEYANASHARAIAAFVIGEESRHEQIDRVRVRIAVDSPSGTNEAAGGELEFEFTVDDLLSSEIPAGPG